MNTLIKADIFFFIAAVATMAVAVLVVVVLIYAIQIFRNVRDISETAKQEANSWTEELAELRGELRKKGWGLSTWLGFLKKRKVERNKKD